MLNRKGKTNQDDLNLGRNLQQDSPTDERPPRSYNARLGFGLFLVYITMYGAVVWMALAKFDTVDSSRLAFFLGVTLVASALILSAIYSRFSRAETNQSGIIEMDSVSVRL